MKRLISKRETIQLHNSSIEQIIDILTRAKNAYAKWNSAVKISVLSDGPSLYQDILFTRYETDAEHISRLAEEEAFQIQLAEQDEEIKILNLAGLKLQQEQLTASIAELEKEIEENNRRNQ